MGLTRRAYARHRKGKGLPGGSLQAVQRALERGRIHLEADGGIDPIRADREWADNTDLSEAPAAVLAQHVAVSGDTDADNRHTPAFAPDFTVTEVIPPLPTSEPSGPAPQTDAAHLQANNAAKAYWQAKQAELDYRRKAGELVPAADVEARLVDVFRRCQTKLRGVPARAKQLLPDLTTAQIARLDDLVREALEDLAAQGCVS